MGLAQRRERSLIKVAARWDAHGSREPREICGVKIFNKAIFGCARNLALSVEILRTRDGKMKTNNGKKTRVVGRDSREDARYIALVKSTSSR